MATPPASAAPATSRPRKRRARVAIAAGVAGVALVGWLLVANYRGSLELSENLVAQHAERVGFDAVSVDHALDTAQDEARELSRSREVAAYLESRDLGMSMRYGLALTIVSIRERVRTMIGEGRGGGSPIFTRIAVVEPGGGVLADSGTGALGVALDADAPPVRVSDDRQRLVVVDAHRFHGRVAVYVVGWVNPARVMAPDDTGQAVTRLVAADGRAWPGGLAGLAPLVRELDLSTIPADGRARWLTGPAGRQTVLVRAPVPGRPLSVLHASHPERIIGRLSPVAAARNVAVAGAVLLVAVVAAVVLSLRSLLLEARLDESLRREEEVAEKHRALAAEVAERERLEAQLRQAQRLEAVGRLAGGVAHDFNNLLSVINGYTVAALEQLPDGAPVRDDIEEVRRAGLRAADLTRQLLAFGRRQMLSPQVLDLGRTLASTDKLLGRLIGAHVELVTTPGAGVRPVRVDPGQLEQILANLVVNARDAMPGGGRITVSTENVQVGAEEAGRHSEAVPGFYVRLRVADTGTGMDAETLAHVFEPFFTTKQSGRGTGLGLSTVYGIVRQSRGFIGVSSVPGRGTTFDVYLPAVFDQEPSVAPEEAPRALPILARPGEVVLFAEDDAPLRRFVAAQLAASGFEVLVAADGQEAARLAEVHELPIDALVTDLMMPGLSGREVADRFRTRHPLAPVIFVSGYSDAAVVGDLRIAPPTAFLQKPQGLEQLGATLRRLLDRASRPIQAVAQGAGR